MPSIESTAPVKQSGLHTVDVRANHPLGFADFHTRKLRRVEKELPLRSQFPVMMTPPKYSPLAEIQSNVMAVPRSILIHGPPYFSKVLSRRPRRDRRPIPVAYPPEWPFRCARRPQARLSILKYFRAVLPALNPWSNDGDHDLVISVADRFSSAEQVMDHHPYSSAARSRIRREAPQCAQCKAFIQNPAQCWCCRYR